MSVGLLSLPLLPAALASRFEPRPLDRWIHRRIHRAAATTLRWNPAFTMGVAHLMATRKKYLCESPVVAHLTCRYPPAPTVWQRPKLVGRNQASRLVGIGPPLYVSILWVDYLLNNICSGCTNILSPFPRLPSSLSMRRGPVLCGTCIHPCWRTIHRLISVLLLSMIYPHQLLPDITLGACHQSQS
jgi:hypothetical protein